MDVTFWVAQWGLSDHEAQMRLGGPTVVMGDTIATTAHLMRPAGLSKVAGYNTGSSDIRWTAAEWALFPNAAHVAIDQSNGTDPTIAPVKDVEPGASNIVNAVKWALGRQRLGYNVATCYVSESGLHDLQHALANAGLKIGPVVAYQIASPSAPLNGNTPLPGDSGHTLRTSNVDVSITRADWFPVPTTPETGHGVANAMLHFNLESKAWQIAGTHGQVRWANDDRSHAEPWDSLEVQVNRTTGHWRLHPLPVDAPPLGGK